MDSPTPLSKLSDASGKGSSRGCMWRLIMALGIRSVGGRTADTVSKKVDYLVVGTEPGSKLEKAKKLEIPVLDETQFLKIFNKEK